MKTIEELREEFEEYCKSNLYLKTYLSKADYGEFNSYESEYMNQYSLGFLNGAWFMFQELKK